MKSEFRDQLVALLPRLRRFAIGLTANPDEADDLLQTACEKALAKQHQWQPGSRLDSWMYRIIQTTRIDSIRRHRIQLVSTEEVALCEELVDEGSASVPETEDLLQHTLKAFNDLPEEQRAVMSLVVVEGHSYSEVAELLGIPLGTVMSRLCRARMKLQAALGQVSVE
jgi:RNA polymerase sigma-70 factor (ECF subfamily)